MLLVVADVMANLAAAAIVAALAVLTRSEYSDARRAGLLLMDVGFGIAFVGIAFYLRTRAAL